MSRHNHRWFHFLAPFLILILVLGGCTGPAEEPAAEAPAAEAPAAEAPAAEAPAAEAPAAEEAAPAEEARLGSTLIGELEGPELVTDQIPAQFQEAPELAERVAAGDLPPVEERLGEEPIVLKPVHEIGKYGGIWRRAFTGPGDKFNGWRAAAGPDGLVFWDYTATTVVPNIAKDFEVSEDGREFTFHLRVGMKWSDGTPFTADDIMFWYEDMYLNDELNPAKTTYMSINGQPGTVEKIDDYTVKFIFPEPYYMFPEVLAGPTTLSGQAAGGLNGGYGAAHYLRQFHADYVDEEELAQIVADEGFDNWVNLFAFKNDWALNPDLPVLSPWKTVSPISSSQWILERNPYSIWVDTEGNQLPYIDRVVMTLAENLEVLNLRAIAGELDFQARHITLSKLPVLLENQETGNYRVHLDIGQYGSDLVIWINPKYDIDPYIGELLQDVNFRRAMSLGIDRDQLNEAFWLGTGTPSSVVPADTNKYNPGPEYRTLWATYDPDLANQMLDELGLDQRDADGWRLRADGGGALRVEIMTKGAQFLEFTQMAEMIKEHWERLGIQVSVKEVERALGYTLEANNETQFSLWTNDGSDDFFLWTASGLPTVFGSFNEYLVSHGERGPEPSDALKEMADIWWRGFGVPEEERIELGKRFWEISADQVVMIGVVGLGAAAQGVRIASLDMGNVPDRQYCTPWVRNPAISRPQTF